MQDDKPQSAILQMTRLGRMGRFANAVIQYAFLRVYAKRHGLRLQVPPWIGETLFGFVDERPDRRLPIFEEKTFHGADDAIIPSLPEPLRNVDVHGYFQYHTGFYAPDREFILGLYAKPVEAVRERLAPAVARLRALSPHVIGLHIRRGDFGQMCFYLTPIPWYLDLLNRIRTPETVLFIASDEPGIVSEFSGFNYVTAADLGVTLSAEPLPGIRHLAKDVADGNATALDFFPDWELLRHCDALAIGNSTYGFSAAWLSRYCRAVYRSDPDRQAFGLIDPWHDVMYQNIRQEDYAHVPGMYLNSNPYWR